MRIPGDEGENSAAPIIEKATPRVVFAQLVASALGDTRAQPSAMAIAYLVELLSDRVRRTETTPRPEGEAEAGDATLTEALYAARDTAGTVRIERLREVGDRALFVSGFFGDSLRRKVVDLDFYRDVGRAAYTDLAAHIDRFGERSWTYLYVELADHFSELVDVLAGVSDRTLGNRPDNLLRLYERFLLTRSERDRGRLLRLGCALPADGRGARDRFWQ